MFWQGSFMFKLFRLSVSLAAAALAVALQAQPASAQAIRTWVSGVGDDVNPCSRTAPCKTFPGAISKTFTGGTINCLDPAGFGAITITKSITIDCDEVFGSILASGVTGVIINIPAGNVNDPLRAVRLRNLTIDGSGAAGAVGTRTGIIGVRIINAATVLIEDSLIQNFTQGGVKATLDPAGVVASNLSLTIQNTTIHNNAGGGVLIVPPANVSAKVALNDVRLTSNPNFGLFVTKSTAGLANVNVNDTLIANNVNFGIRSVGANSTVRLNHSVVTGNTNGLDALTSGKILSFGNNVIEGNNTDGAPTGSIALE